MKTQDLSKILIKDTKYYWCTNNYNYTLKKFHIDTVEKILNKEIMEPVFASIYKMDAKMELNGLIRLLEYEYLGKPLNNEELLERRIVDFTYHDRGIVFYLDNKEKAEGDRFTSDGLFKDIIIGMSYPGNTISWTILDDEELQKKIRVTKPTVVELLKMVLRNERFACGIKSKGVKVTKHIIEANIESYENKNTKSSKKTRKSIDVSIGTPAVSILQKDLTRLIKMSEELTAEIDVVGKQIKVLEKQEKKRSVR